ncbi:MAG: hypothetical protein KatS3mg109_1737 [Pirellulaceae bacterium]|nr:MAG: hypothetical protein KatS3mg105_5199 [Gemmatales bacterium]GIW91305.1 MAG: hypothetical protein KatS3mg109_1737 [Pirellulaceae bacterium]
MWTLREDFFVAEVLRRPLPRPPCDFRYPMSQYRVLHLLTVNGYFFLFANIWELNYQKGLARIESIAIHTSRPAKVAGESTVNGYPS